MIGVFGLSGREKGVCEAKEGSEGKVGVNVVVVFEKSPKSPKSPKSFVAFGEDNGGIAGGSAAGNIEAACDDRGGDVIGGLATGAGAGGGIDGVSDLAGGGASTGVTDLAGCIGGAEEDERKSSQALIPPALGAEPPVKLAGLCTRSVAAKLSAAEKSSPPSKSIADCRGG